MKRLMLDEELLCVKVEAEGRYNYGKRYPNVIANLAPNVRSNIYPQRYSESLPKQKRRFPWMQELSGEAEALVCSIIEEHGYKAIDMIAAGQIAIHRLRES